MLRLRGLGAVALGTTAGLIALLVEFGAWCWIAAARDPSFAPEMGLVASYLVFSAVLATFFVSGFLLLSCPVLVLVHRRLPGKAVWRKAMLAGVSLLAGVPVMMAVSGGWHDAVRDGVLVGLLLIGPGMLGARVALAVQS